MSEAEPLDALLQRLSSPQSNGWRLQIPCRRSGCRAGLSRRLRRWNLPKLRRRHRLRVLVEANDEMDLGSDVPGWPMISQVDDDGLRGWGSRCEPWRADCTHGPGGSVHAIDVTPRRSATSGFRCCHWLPTPGFDRVDRPAGELRMGTCCDDGSPSARRSSKRLAHQPGSAPSSDDLRAPVVAPTGFEPALPA